LNREPVYGKYDQYRTVCPSCGGSIMLVGFTATCRVPILSEGWDLLEGSVDTSEEVFRCDSCNIKMTLEDIMIASDDEKVYDWVVGVALAKPDSLVDRRHMFRLGIGQELGETWHLMRDNKDAIRSFLVEHIRKSSGETVENADILFAPSLGSAGAYELGIEIVELPQDIGE
jgi:hypothetical protein